MFHGTEISQNSVPNHASEEENARNSVPWNKNIANSQNSVLNHSAKEKVMWNSVPNYSAVEKTTQNSVQWNKNRGRR